MKNRYIEEEHQKMLFQWASHYKLNCLNYQAPPKKLSDVMFAIPNGGFRNEREGARMKAGGVKAGVPDVCIPIAASGFNSLYLELKRPLLPKTPKPAVTANQKKVMRYFIKCGSACVVAYGYSEAVDLIKKYLDHQLSPADLFGY